MRKNFNITRPEHGAEAWNVGDIVEGGSGRLSKSGRAGKVRRWAVRTKGLFQSMKSQRLDIKMINDQ